MTAAPPTESSPKEPDAARAVVKHTMRLPIAHRFRLAWRLGGSPLVPMRARVPLLALILYLAMPLDIVPDFIPVIGLLDDLLIAGIAVWWFLRVCPPAVALAEIERLELMPVGRTSRLVPVMLVFAGILVLAFAIAWWFIR